MFLLRVWPGNHQYRLYVVYGFVSFFLKRGRLPVPIPWSIIANEFIKPEIVFSLLMVKHLQLFHFYAGVATRSNTINGPDSKRRNRTLPSVTPRVWMSATASRACSLENLMTFGVFVPATIQHSCCVTKVQKCLKMITLNFGYYLLSRPVQELTVCRKRSTSHFLSKTGALCECLRVRISTHGVMKHNFTVPKQIDQWAWFLHCKNLYSELSSAQIEVDFAKAQAVCIWRQVWQSIIQQSPNS